jgi:hypothetical protein
MQINNLARVVKKSKVHVIRDVQCAGNRTPDLSLSGPTPYHWATRNLYIIKPVVFRAWICHHQQKYHFSLQWHVTTPSHYCIKNILIPPQIPLHPCTQMFPFYYVMRSALRSNQQNVTIGHCLLMDLLDVQLNLLRAIYNYIVLFSLSMCHYIMLSAACKV